MHTLKRWRRPRGHETGLRGQIANTATEERELLSEIGHLHNRLAARAANRGRIVVIYEIH